MQCNKCGTTDAPHWITQKFSNVVETNSKGLLTFKNEAKTITYCPTSVSYTHLTLPTKRIV